MIPQAYVEWKQPDLNIIMLVGKFLKHSRLSSVTVGRREGGLLVVDYAVSLE